MKNVLLGLLALLFASTAWADLDQLKHAALAGNAEKQYELGVLYEYGFGLKSHRVPALAWYSIAAANGSKPAAAHRDAIKARMSKDEIAQAERERDALQQLIAETQQKSTAPVAVPASAPTASTTPVSAPAP